MDRQPAALAAYLEQKRKEEGILQNEQAAKMELTPNELNRYIKGKRELKKDLQKIIACYGNTANELRAIYGTQISQEEINRAENVIKDGLGKRKAIDLVVYIKYGV